MPFDAIIFDLDGTLIDSERALMAAGRVVLERRGLILSDDLFSRLVGTTQEDGEAILRDAFGPLDFDAIDREWKTEHHRRGDLRCALRPGAGALLDHLSKQGFPLAIATSSSRKGATHKLSESGLAPHFSEVVSRDCVAAPKPAPEPYLLAASRLNVAPSRCLAFEDSEPGARSAFAAGMCVVQVPDLIRTKGQFAHHVATDLISGARAAGLQIG